MLLKRHRCKLKKSYMFLTVFSFDQNSFVCVVVELICFSWAEEFVVYIVRVPRAPSLNCSSCDCCIIEPSLFCLFLRTFFKGEPCLSPMLGNNCLISSNSIACSHLPGITFAPPKIWATFSLPPIWEIPQRRSLRWKWFNKYSLGIGGGWSEGIVTDNSSQNR